MIIFVCLVLLMMVLLFGSIGPRDVTDTNPEDPS